jgi:hypothetical protein
MTIDLKKDVGGDPVLVPIREVDHCVVYLCYEEYGGPEEGGWYYRCGKPVISVPLIFGTEVNRKVQERLERWADQYNREWDPQYRHDYAASVRVQLGKDVKPFPDTVPHYE